MSTGENSPLSSDLGNINTMARQPFARLAAWGAASAVLAMLLAAPLVGSNYHLHALILSMIFLYPALGLNLILGYTGMLSFAQAAFFGIGAYTSALFAIHFQTPFLLNFFLAGIVSALIALPLAIPALRLRNQSFVMCTLGFVVLAETISKNWVSLTRGDLGLSQVPPPSIAFMGHSIQIANTADFYLMALVFACVGVAAFYFLVTSPAGRVMIAIRDNETLAESVGTNVWRYKMVIFSLSAAFAGLGGSLYAHYMTVVSPLMFQFYYTNTILIAVLGGGPGTILGTVFGSFLFVAVSEALRITPEYRMVIFGLMLLLLVFVFPKGLLPTAIDAVRRRLLSRRVD
jgi:branched-chain amino acid transport system permease protein